MMAARNLLIALICGGALSACERIPGTDAYLIAHGKKVAADNLIDPSSAQFRNLELRSGPADKQKKPIKALCGEINGKNRQGAYAGFGRFMASTTDDNIVMDPQETVTQEDVDRAGRRCKSGDPIYSEAEREYRISLCEDAKEAVIKHANQELFENAWQAVCAANAKPSTQ